MEPTRTPLHARPARPLQSPSRPDIDAPSASKPPCPPHPAPRGEIRRHPHAPRKFNFFSRSRRFTVDSHFEPCSNPQVGQHDPADTHRPGPLPTRRPHITPRLSNQPNNLNDNLVSSRCNRSNHRLTVESQGMSSNLPSDSTKPKHTNKSSSNANRPSGLPLRCIRKGRDTVGLAFKRRSYGYHGR